eukprot:8522808-Alexandrium_andersonii.AAC.1
MGRLSLTGCSSRGPLLRSFGKRLMAQKPNVPRGKGHPVAPAPGSKKPVPWALHGSSVQVAK